MAVVIQILGAAFTPEDGENVLKSKSSLAPRLSTLTVIIMGKCSCDDLHSAHLLNPLWCESGEGLNGICGTLQHTMKSLGLTHSTVAQAIAFVPAEIYFNYTVSNISYLRMVMVLYFMWLLYFDGRSLISRWFHRGWYRRANGSSPWDFPPERVSH